jgi:hypothetical protein
MLLFSILGHDTHVIVSALFDPFLYDWRCLFLLLQVSLVLEYCDWGSLRTALDAGAFFAGEQLLVNAACLTVCNACLAKFDQLPRLQQVIPAVIVVNPCYAWLNKFDRLPCL